MLRADEHNEAGRSWATCRIISGAVFCSSHDTSGGRVAVVRKQSGDGDQSDVMQFILGAEDTSKIVFAKLISDAQVPAMKNLMNKWAKFEPLLQEFDGMDHWASLSCGRR